MKRKKVSELAKQIRGVSYNPEDLHENLDENSVTLLRANNIFEGRINFDDVVYVDKSKVTMEQYLCKGDILVCASSGSKQLVGKAASFNFETECTFGAFCKVVRPNQDVANYLSVYFQSNAYRRKISEVAIGANINNIRNEHIDALELPIGSNAENEKVVASFSLLQQIIDGRKQQLHKLDDLVKARFVELFGNPISNPMKWDTYQLEECLERIDNGKSFICSDKPRVGDTPAILKLSAATYGDYRPNENKALLDESLFVESAEVHAGDLLFTRKNTPELVGTAAYVQNTPSKLMMPDLIFRLVPNEKVNAVFLWQLINCKEFRPVIQAISGGSAKSMSNISKERLGKIKVICPPRELQDSLIPFVEQTDKSKAAIQKALDEAQLLFDSLMQKYFG